MKSKRERENDVLLVEAIDMYNLRIEERLANVRNDFYHHDQYARRKK